MVSIRSAALMAALIAFASGQAPHCDENNAECVESNVAGSASILQRSSKSGVAEIDDDMPEPPEPPLIEEPPLIARSLLSPRLLEIQKAVGRSGVRAMRTPTGEEKQQFLDATNKYRCMHGADNVVWSDAMAEDASNYISDMTTLVHSASYELSPPAGPAGENLYSASWAATPTEAVDAWYSEVDDCVGGPAGFTDGCLDGRIVNNKAKTTGHFTALVWKGVQSIGCAFSQSDVVMIRIIICRYKAGDSLTSDTPNMNGRKGNYKIHVFPLTKSTSECASGSGNGGSGDSTEATPLPTAAIDYEHCVESGSIGQCGKCTHTSQCSGSSFCCPYMKMCVPTSSTSCPGPVWGDCSPTCSDSSADGAVNCKCDGGSQAEGLFPTTWLGRTCGPNGGPLPTPSPTASPTPYPPGVCAGDVYSKTTCGRNAHMGYCGQNSGYVGQANKYVQTSTSEKFVAYMTKYCCRTCGFSSSTVAPTPAPTPEPVVGSGNCIDKQPKHKCDYWAEKEYCTRSYVNYMTTNCCGTCAVFAAADAETPEPTPAETEEETPEPTPAETEEEKKDDDDSTPEPTPAEEEEEKKDDDDSTPEPTPAEEDEEEAATMGCVTARGTGQCTITTACSSMVGFKKAKVSFTCTPKDQEGVSGEMTVTMAGSHTWDLSSICSSCSPLTHVTGA